MFASPRQFAGCVHLRSEPALPSLSLFLSLCVEAAAAVLAAPAALAALALAQLYRPKVGQAGGAVRDGIVSRPDRSSDSILGFILSLGPCGEERSQYNILSRELRQEGGPAGETRTGTQFWSKT